MKEQKQPSPMQTVMPCDWCAVLVDTTSHPQSLLYVENKCYCQSCGDNLGPACYHCETFVDFDPDYPQDNPGAIIDGHITCVKCIKKAEIKARKYSPVPWKSRGSVILDEKNNIVAVTNPLTEKGKANAQFIARACTAYHGLINTLEEAKAHLNNYDFQNACPEDSMPIAFAMIAIDKALAKAKARARTGG